MCLRSWNCQQNWYVNTKCGYNQADTLLSMAPCGFHQLSEKSLFKKKTNMPASGVLKSAIAMCVGTGKEETCSGAGMQLSLLAYLFSPAVGYVDLVHMCEKTTSSLK